MHQNYLHFTIIIINIYFTFGIYGLFNSLFNNFYHGKFLNQECYLNSYGPLNPKRFAGFLYINLFIKSADSNDQLSGISDLFI